MKKYLLIAGIVCIIGCVLSLLFAALNRFGYYHLMDGTADLYASLYQMMIISFVSGIVLAAAGAVCLIIRATK